MMIDKKTRDAIRDWGDDQDRRYQNVNFTRREWHVIREVLAAELPAPSLSDETIQEIFRKNCVHYAGNYEVTPGGAAQIAKKIASTLPIIETHPGEIRLGWVNGKAISPLGVTYKVYAVPGGIMLEVNAVDHIQHHPRFKNVDEAKTAAQADHDMRAAKAAAKADPEKRTVMIRGRFVVLTGVALEVYRVMKRRETRLLSEDLRRKLPHFEPPDYEILEF